MKTNITFDAIKSFVKDLNELFGEKQRTLKLYNHLLGKTEYKHENSVKRHCSLFQTFCISNRSGIEQQKFELFESFIVEYSEKILIDFEEIFRFIKEDSSMGNDTVKAIKKHLLYISALVDEESNAKNILKEGVEEKDGNTFLVDIINKVKDNIDPDAKDPKEAMNSILQSDMIGEIMTSVNDNMKDGSIDFTSMLGPVQNMLSQLEKNTAVEEGEENTSTKGMKNINKMISGINKTLGDIDFEDEEGLDIGKILGPLMQNMTNEDGEGPDFGSMLGPIMESLQGEDGEPVDLSAMLGPLMENLGGEDGEGPDLSAMLGPLMENLGGEDGPLGNILGGNGIPGGTDGMSNIMNLVSTMSSGDGMSIEEKLNMEYEKSKKK